MRRRSLHGWSWGIADQALSSLINLLVGVAVARAVSPREFGAFALALTFYWLALGANRALTSEPYVVRYGSAATPALAGLRAAAGTSVGLGAAAALICLIAATFAGGSLALSLLALAPALLPLLLQDFVRAASFATRRPAVAFGADAICLVVLVVGWAFLAATRNEGLVYLTLTWGTAAGVAATVGMARLGILPDGRRAWGWLHEHSGIAPGFLLENIVLALSVQLSFVAVGAIGGLTATGAMRAAQVLFGPWQVLLMGTGLYAFPEGVRLLESRGTRGLIWFSIGLAGGLMVASIATTVVISLVPDSVGTSLLGTSWPGAKPLILLTGLSLVTTSAIVGAALGLRALAAVRRSVPLRIATSAGVIGGAAIGAGSDGARGALIGISLAGVAAAVLWWWQLWLECLVRRQIEVARTPTVSALGSDG